MKKSALIIAILALVTASAWAQDAERRRGNQERRRGGRDRGPAINRVVDRLAEQLDFDDEQLRLVKEVAAAYEEREQQERQQRREDREAGRVGESRSEGDRESGRRRGGRGGENIQSFMDEIEPILHEDQLEALQQIRERMSQRRGADGRDAMRRMTRELPDAVEMTDEQREGFQELLDEQRELMRERRQQRRARNETGDAEPGETGDVERDRRRGRPDPAAMIDEFFEQTAELLNEEQLVLLADYRVQMESRMRERESPQSDDLQTILSAVKRVKDLEDEQKQALRDIERDAMRSSRKLERTDKDGKAILAAEAKKQIEKLLNAEQTEEFRRNIESLKSKSRRGERGRRDGERPGRNQADRPNRP